METQNVNIITVDINTLPEIEDLLDSDYIIALQGGKSRRVKASMVKPKPAPDVKMEWGEISGTLNDQADLREKFAGIKQNVQSDWDATEGGAEILNKPNLSNLGMKVVPLADEAAYNALVKKDNNTIYVW